jgi:hypothetical protein
MQITQFVVGASFAFLHLFVAYQIPVSVPYLYHVAPKIASMVATDVSSAVSTITTSVAADPLAAVKKGLLRAAGFEGLAENVGLSQPVTSAGVQAAIPPQYIAQAEQRYKNELQWVHCLDTSGQVYAILLNVVYLAPLTWLFVNFFIKAYLTQLERRRSSAAAEQARIASLSIGDASKGVVRRLSQAVTEMHETGDSSENDSPVVESSESIETLKKKARDAADESTKAIREKATQAAQSAKENASFVGQKVSEAQHAAQESASKVTEAAKPKIQEAVEAVREQKPIAEDIKDKANKVGQKVEEKTPSADQAKAKAEDVKGDAKDVGKNASESSQDAPKSEGPTSEVTKEKSFADATKEESKEGKSETSFASPNDDGTGAGAASDLKTVESEEAVKAKKEEDKIIDESQEVRDDDKDTEPESGADVPKTNGGQSNIPRPKKKNKNKKKA